MSHHRCCCGGGNCQCLGRCRFSGVDFLADLFIGADILLGGSNTGRYCPNDVDCAPVCELSPHGVESIHRTFQDVSLACGNRCFNHTVAGPQFDAIQCRGLDTDKARVNGALQWCFGEGTLGNSEPVPVGVVAGTAAGALIYVSVTVGTATIQYPINRFELDQPTLLDNTSKRCGAGSNEGRVRNIVWGMRSLANTSWAAGYTMHLGGNGPLIENLEDWGGAGSAGWFGPCGNEIMSLNFSAFVRSVTPLNGCPNDTDATASGFAEYSYPGIATCGLAPDPPPPERDLPRRLEHHRWTPGDPLPSGLPLTLYRARRTISAATAAEDLL